MSSQKPFQSKIFVPSARVFRTLYINIDGFKNDHIAVYDILYHYWNAAEGYAWPTSVDIQMEAGISETTVTKVIRELVEWGLIEIVSNPKGDNNTYNVKRPIEDEMEFYRVFPEALRNKQERRERADARASRPKKRKRTTSVTKTSAVPKAGGYVDGIYVETAIDF
ncbi:MarR family transcriptional regulator [Paenibacillus polymyxa]|uniref:MarR family transcriptional regulator n=1 Tax=Paenibacillus polymyxa TaxID=1406 RepID=UPI0008460622|nr:helix-turn-helix domain-containing protein [Paenibacillus polymyxa]AOK88963.1 hypothetical protein AOU00_03565 [Paenibacillus polymyxa]